MFIFPYRAGPGIKRQSLRITQTIGPDLWPRAGLFHKRIIVRHAAIGVEPQQFALQLIEILRGAADKIIAERDPEVALSIKRQPGADIVAAGEHRRLPDYLAEIAELPVIRTQRPDAHDGTCFAAAVRLGVAEPDATAGRKIGCQHHIQQATLPFCPDLWHTLNRLRQATLRTPAAQRSATLGNQQRFVVGQEGNRPWML